MDSFRNYLINELRLGKNATVSFEDAILITEGNAVIRERGESGMPNMLPGINIIFGLMDENEDTHTENMKNFQRLLDENLLVRRINIRQVAILPGTRLAEEAGNKFLKKNKSRYWRWRNEIRQKVDLPMLKKVLPTGTILSDVYTEIYDGDTTFARQFGTYPIVIGIKGRLPLKKFINVKVTSHNLRSVTGKIV